MRLFYLIDVKCIFLLGVLGVLFKIDYILDFKVSCNKYEKIKIIYFIWIIVE